MNTLTFPSLFICLICVAQTLVYLYKGYLDWAKTWGILALVFAVIYSKG